MRKYFTISFSEVFSYFPILSFCEMLHFTYSAKQKHAINVEHMRKQLIISFGVLFCKTEMNHLVKILRENIKPLVKPCPAN
jgi:hypothetical protein